MPMRTARKHGSILLVLYPAFNGYKLAMQDVFALPARLHYDQDTAQHHVLRDPIATNIYKNHPRHDQRPSQGSHARLRGQNLE
jgi:hypothetical protein